MSLLKETGTFRGIVQEHAVNLSSGGCPQWVGKLQAVEKYDYDAAEWNDYQEHEDCEITAYLTLFTKEQKPIFHVDSVKKVFDWDGASLAALDSMDLHGAALQFNVDEHEYEDKVSLQVTNISGFDDTPSTGGVRKLDAKSLKDMDAKFGNALQQASGGPKPATAPKSNKKGNKPAAPKTNTAPKNNKGTKVDKSTKNDEATDEKTEASTPSVPAPPAPPAAPKNDSADEIRYSTKDEAWVVCYEMKAKTVTDEQIAKAFTAAINKVAKGINEDDITAAQWNTIAELVLAEYGVF